MALGNSYDLEIKQGATLSLNITWKDSNGALINLTGYSARMQARATYESTTAIFSLENGSGITLGGAAGTIDVVISATATAALTAPWAGVWDLEIVSGSNVVTRLLEGAAYVSPEVTK